MKIYDIQLKIVIVILVCLLFHQLTYAESWQVEWPSEKHKVISETIRVITAYNAGDPAQTDDTPCIAANNENICIALELGESLCAANFVPLGTKLYIENLGFFTVVDRTNRRYKNRVDIAMMKHEKKEALIFGRQKLTVKILE